MCRLLVALRQKEQLIGDLQEGQAVGSHALKEEVARRELFVLLSVAGGEASARSSKPRSIRCSSFFSFMKEKANRTNRKMQSAGMPNVNEVGA